MQSILTIPCHVRSPFNVGTTSYWPWELTELHIAMSDKNIHSAVFKLTRTWKWTQKQPWKQKWKMTILYTDIDMDADTEIDIDMELGRFC
jgi:hypothetical protein